MTSKVISLPVALFDDLDKELNNYNMRCREWYGWHFPELGKIVTDNLTYARAVKAIGTGGGMVIALWWPGLHSHTQTYASTCN